MTFKQELRKITDKARISLSIKEKMDEIKEKMVETAEAGIGSFQIEVVQIYPDNVYSMPKGNVNYYAFVIDADSCNNDYKDFIIAYLKELGFSTHNIEAATLISKSGYCTCINVRW